MGVWWLSFADGKDGHSLGACIVEVADVEGEKSGEEARRAHLRATALGINPGGSVQLAKCRPELAKEKIPKEHWNTLKSRDEWNEIVETTDTSDWESTESD